MKLIHCICITAILLMSFSSLNAEEITLCDIEAAHPSDPNHVGEGKSSANVDTFAAINACRTAVKESPDTARFHYQLGRALFYQGEVVEGITHVQHAADMDYTQAQFVLGLLKKNEDICIAEALFKAAADKGLKSARITYVNDTVSKAYANCDVSVSQETLQGYLDKTEPQMEGYYEEILHRKLNNELKIMMDAE